MTTPTIQIQEFFPTTYLGVYGIRSITAATCSPVVLICPKTFHTSAGSTATQTLPQSKSGLGTEGSNEPGVTITGGVRITLVTLPVTVTNLGAWQLYVTIETVTVTTIIKTVTIKITTDTMTTVTIATVAMTITDSPLHFLRMGWIDHSRRRGYTHRPRLNRGGSHTLYWNTRSSRHMSSYLCGYGRGVTMGVVIGGRD